MGETPNVVGLLVEGKNINILQKKFKVEHERAVVGDVVKGEMPDLMVPARLINKEMGRKYKFACGDLNPPNRARFEGCLPASGSARKSRTISNKRWQCKIVMAVELGSAVWNISATMAPTNMSLVSTGSYEPDDEYWCLGWATDEELRRVQVSDSDIQMTSNTESHDSGLTRD
ncbi:hypothetical protein FB451DRAFT_1163988 [Mycena latifolia]|nr:hypothetical protein FB451DRAFT_1163988 [Mycena latifolia]